MPEGPRVVTSRMGSPDLGDVERAEAHGKAVTIWDLHTTPVNRSSSVLIPAIATAKEPSLFSEESLTLVLGEAFSGPHTLIQGEGRR